MSTTDPAQSEKEVLSQSDVEHLLAQVGEQQSQAAADGPGAASKELTKEGIQPYDFRCPAFLSPNEMRKLRVSHETFIQSLAARLSIHLRLEFGMQMSQLQTLTYQKFVENLNNPCHLTLFKVEPLRGICILDLNPRLGLTIIDRLMGGPGQSATINRDLSEVEMALLDQAVQLILDEWCHHWTKVQEVRPVLLGHENTGRFLQTSAPDAVMLVLSIEARIGDCVEQMQIGFPYTTLEPLVQGLSLKLNASAEQAPAVTAPQTPKWSHHFDDLEIPVTATWPGIKLTARTLANLKVGEVLPLPAEFANSVRLCIGGSARFLGRLGTSDQRWAVELTDVLRT